MNFTDYIPYAAGSILGISFVYYSLRYLFSAPFRRQMEEKIAELVRKGDWGI